MLVGRQLHPLLERVGSDEVRQERVREHEADGDVNEILEDAAR